MITHSLHEQDGVLSICNIIVKTVHACLPDIETLIGNFKIETLSFEFKLRNSKVKPQKNSP